MQGEFSMTADGKANLQKWRNLNPTWNVRVWDIQTLSAFVRAHASPHVRDAWDKLTVASAAASDPRPSYGMLSDFGRLILCHLQSGNWNAYVDDDCEPLRSLDDFMVQTEWHDHNTNQDKSFNIPDVHPVEWDGVRPFNVLFSGENINNRNTSKLSVNNNFLLARPNTELMDSIINWCIERSHMNVLRSYGPWAITDFFYTIREYVKTYGFVIIPWHYFNWLDKYMTPAKHPSWTVCLHNQSLRWAAEGDSGWTAGADGRPGQQLMMQ